MSTTTTAQPAVQFNEIPATWEVPGSKMEIRPSYQQVGILAMPARVLIIGQMTPSGLATPLTVIPNVTTATTGRAAGGAGSIIDGQVSAHLLSNQTVPLDIICVADASGSAKAVWTHTFAGPATANGTPAMLVAGTRIQIGTLNGDTATIAATEWAAALNAIPNLPFTVTQAAAVVTLTAKNAGVEANNLTFVPNPADGDQMPAGLTVTVAQTVQGATNPSIAAALALVPTRWYTDIIIPWEDTTNVQALAAETERRYNAMVALDMRAHVPCSGTFSQQLAAIFAANARFVYFSPMTAPGSPPWAVAAAAGGAAAQSLINDPSRQMNGIALPGIVGPVPANCLTDAQKEMMLVAGGSVFHVAHNYSVQMERYMSSYTENAQGILDPGWTGDIMIAAVATAIRYDWRTYWDLTYPNNKLAPSGSLAAAANSAIVTVARAKGSWTARMMVYAANGWVVDEVNQAKRSVFVVDANDPNRLDSQHRQLHRQCRRAQLQRRRGVTRHAIRYHHGGLGWE
jgi:phage tail sheath gpL-like